MHIKEFSTNKTKLCLFIYDKLSIAPLDQVKALKDIGFDAFFTRWDGDAFKFRELADKHGMIYQSIHAPNDKTQFLWERGEGADLLINEWIACVNDCADAGVSIMVLHPFKGMDTSGKPNKNGVENLSRVVDVAEKRGVNIAIENCEGEEYLGALLDAFSDCQSVGFCWDTGHEKCYNRGLDMMERFGSRIICTHVNDNMGVRDPEGRITPKDDLHLLPFDGINDWASVKKRLNDRNYSGILTFELKKSARYDNMTSEEFLIEAYNRARRIAEL